MSATIVRHAIGGAAAMLLLPFAASAETLELEAFDAIEAAVGAELKIQVGPEQSVVVEGEDRDEFTVEVRGRTLVVKPERSRTKFDGVDLRLTVTMPSLTALELSTGASAQVAGIDAERLDVEISTGANATLTGRCDELTIEVSTGANADAGELICDTVVAEASTGANLDVHAGEALEASASLGGRIDVEGDPERLRVKESLGGSVGS